MPWIKVWIHFVWSTANHEPILTDPIRTRVFQHIRENAKKKGIYIDLINGYLDHVHCLVSLGSDQTLEKIMQLVKGESSFWINQNELTKTKFAWQKEYFAVSVNPLAWMLFGDTLQIRSSITGIPLSKKNLKIFWLELDLKGLRSPNDRVFSAKAGSLLGSLSTS